MGLKHEYTVFFVSRVVLERAYEILREVHPDGTAEQQNERTEERHEKREGDDDQTDAGDESTDETDRIGFEYLERLGASIHDIAYLLERDQLGDRDVRVCADELPPPLQ